MTLYIASDHAGFEVKKELISYIIGQKLHLSDPVDLGTFDLQSVDYPDYAKKLCEHIVTVDDVGVLLCGTGVGICIAANRYKHIRAASCHNETEAFYARSHNNANVLCLGARILGIETLHSIVHKFLTTPFSNQERHIKRIEKMSS